MAYLMNLIVENYKELLETKRDPLVDKWLFMHSPIPVFTILALYLYFVLNLGPNYMKNRKPFELKQAMIFYNLYQVLFSLWLCSHVLKVKNAIPHFLSYTCRNTSSNQEFQAMLASGAWWYFFSKVTELLDTVFFVLRKKQAQVSFLHVYHHSVTMIGSWAYLKYIPGEQGLVIGFLNSLVHIVMYFYYFLSALGPKYQKYLWWKKYMTWMQLTQFGIMLAYLALIVVMDCKLPRALTYFFVTNVIIFIYLFSDYYRKAYFKKSKAVISQNEKMEENNMKGYPNNGYSLTKTLDDKKKG
ncbi:hypothetical protein ABEB36_011641 [Hypothenemus hampei]|uniref:Elongation of very long chain fatty acids protein n=1 Tax=Hypothenemus hampei TaxID=57062 RepID=A0ABD1E8I3_HYPHA